ncbi:MAG TPA: tail fiber domain-containing protein [Bacteroidia bacterium]|nr:tail fiber domain-containing protein [Bacteroidia bacterium]
MKKYILFLLAQIFILSGAIRAQNVSITGNGANPDPSAMLDIQSSTMGLSIPNIALTATNSSSPIAATPKTGLIVFNTATAGTSPNNVVPGFYYWNGSKWMAFVSGSNGNWGTNGNAGTTAGSNFVGTTDAVDFVTMTNNAEVMRATSGGNIGIGNTIPVSKLDIATGTTTVNSIVNAVGKINDFLQFNIQNTSNGAHAQSGYSATADNGSPTTGFAWLGINNSNFNYPTTYNIGGVNDVSFLGSGQDLYLANANNSKSIIFSTGTATTPFFAERMRITNAGNVGIGNSAPVSKLDVAASTTTVNTVVNATGSINDFLQYNIQNTSTGTNAQSGYSATADNGSATTGFAWLGINNSNFNYPTTYNIGGTNDVSFLGSGQDLYVANANNTKSIIFSTGTSTTPFFAERMRITNAGYIGMGTNAPVARLDVEDGVTTNNTVMNAEATINDFLQLNVQNNSAGTQAQSGFSATADNGTNLTGFVWMGINNSNFNFPTAYNIGLGDDVSFLGCGNDLYVANSNTTKSIIFSTGKAGSPYFAERMRITNAGNVGIGTASPSYPLDVQAVVSSAITNFGYLNSAGGTGYTSGTSGSVNFSARFAGRVISMEFMAQSDQRIKEIKSRSNSGQDLAILNAIQITNYEMKDKVIWGNKQFKKVIAQEVEKVYPQVVSQAKGFVPDIYKDARVEKVDSSFRIICSEAITVNAGTKRIRIITADGPVDMNFLTQPDAGTLMLKGNCPSLKSGDKVFVYGQEVDDFRVVDYEGLSTLNISATQELYKLLMKQQDEIVQLKKENGELKTDLSVQIESLRAQINAFLNPVVKK